MKLILLERIQKDLQEDKLVMSMLGPVLLNGFHNSIHVNQLIYLYMIQVVERPPQ